MAIISAIRFQKSAFNLSLPIFFILFIRSLITLLICIHVDPYLFPFLSGRKIDDLLSPGWIAHPTDGGHFPTDDGLLPTDDGLLPTDDGLLPIDDEHFPTDGEHFPTDDALRPGDCLPLRAPGSGGRFPALDPDQE
jgi:hypothetical protein